MGIGIAVNAALAGGAFWYTWEARQQRLQAQEQLKVMARQIRISIFPELLPGIVAYSEEVATQWVNSENAEDKKWGKEIQHSARKAGVPIKYFCAVFNYSDKLATIAVACVYLGEDKKFLKGYCGVTVTANDEVWIPVPEEPVTKKEVVADWVYHLGSDSKRAETYLTKDKDNYVILLFSDAEGNIHGIKRQFGQSLDGITYKHYGCEKFSC